MMNATRSGVGPAVDSGRAVSDARRVPSRARRHREAAMRQAVTRTHASGAPFLSILPRRAQARTNASCTTS
jgi:hypothetical protein